MRFDLMVSDRTLTSGRAASYLVRVGLDQSKLASELKKFCDPEDGSFSAYPATVVEARQKWAAAFHTYVQDMVITSPSGVAPTSGTAVLSGVQTAFFGQLQLTASMSASDAAQDFADAWAAGMNAITLTGVLQYRGGGKEYAGDKFDLIDAQKSSLKSNLQALFEDATLDAGTRCDAIASHFHSATDEAAKKNAVTFTRPNGTTAGTETVDWG